MKSEIRDQKSEIRLMDGHRYLVWMQLWSDEDQIAGRVMLDIEKIIRNKKSEIRNQKSEIRNQKSWLPRLKTPWGENNFHAQQIFYQVHCTFSPITKQRDQMSPGQTSPVFENWLSTVHTVENITIKILQRLLLLFQCIAWGVKILGFSWAWFRLLSLHTCK